MITRATFRVYFYIMTSRVGKCVVGSTRKLTNIGHTLIFIGYSRFTAFLCLSGRVSEKKQWRGAPRRSGINIAAGAVFYVARAKIENLAVINRSRAGFDIGGASGRRRCHGEYTEILERIIYGRLHAS